MVDPVSFVAGLLTAGAATYALEPAEDEFEFPSCGETYHVRKRRGDLCVKCNLKGSIGTH